MWGSMEGWRDCTDYGLYGLGSQSGHWAQIDSASLCISTVLVSTRLTGISRNNSFIGLHPG